MPKDVKKWLMVIKDIKGPGSFKIIILINTVNGDLHIKDTKNFKPYAKILASKYPKFFEILSKILHNEFKNIPKNKLLELDSVWLLSTWEKWNMNYRYKNNPRKRINYDPTNLSDPVNPLNPGNPTSPISLMNPANQPQFMSFF